MQFDVCLKPDPKMPVHSDAMTVDNSFSDQYDSETTEVVINSRRYTLLVPSRIEPFIDPQDTLFHFPLWAKIWPAAIVLAEYVARLKPDAGRTVLELGGGLGLTSIVAASHGHRITLSEGNPDALQFARASAELNPGGPFPIISFDWNRPSQIGRFDLLLASEVVYREEDIPLLGKVFDACLAPRGEIIIAGEIRRTFDAFIQQMSAFYDISAQRKHMRSDDETITVVLFRMRSKTSGLKGKYSS
jgi:predicted nicotinamide N-methyase